MSRTQSIRRGLVLLALLPVGCSVPAGAAEADSPPPAVSLTLETALSTAHQNSQVLAAASLSIEEARGDLIGASLLLVDNPEFTFESGSRRPRALGAEAGPDVSIGIEQRFETGGQRRHRMARANAAIAVARAGADDVQRVIDLAVARSYYSALAAELRARLLAQNERFARELSHIAARRLEAGEGTLLDVNAARIRLAEAQRRRIEAETRRRDARVRLAELLGLSPFPRIALPGSIPGDEAPPPTAELVERAFRGRPDLAAAAREIDAATARIHLADAQAWPDIGLGLFYQYDGDDVFTAGLSVPLPVANRNQGDRARARAARKRLEASQKALRLAIESEVYRSLMAYEKARTTLELYDAQTLRAQEESLDLLQRAFEAGEVGIPDVITVQRVVLEGSEGYVEVRLELALARATLLAAANLPQTAALQGGTP